MPAERTMDFRSLHISSSTMWKTTAIALLAIFACLHLMDSAYVVASPIRRGRTASSQCPAQQGRLRTPPFWFVHMCSVRKCMASLVCCAPFGYKEGEVSTQSVATRKMVKANANKFVGKCPFKSIKRKAYRTRLAKSKNFDTDACTSIVTCINASVVRR